MQVFFHVLYQHFSNVKYFSFILHLATRFPFFLHLLPPCLTALFSLRLTPSSCGPSSKPLSSLSTRCTFAPTHKIFGMDDTNYILGFTWFLHYFVKTDQNCMFSIWLFYIYIYIYTQCRACEQSWVESRVGEIVCFFSDLKAGWAPVSLTQQV